MTLEELKQFATTYEKIQTKAHKLYNTLDAIDKHYKIPNSYDYAGWFSFDNFDVEAGCIELYGSYSVQGDHDNKSYSLTLQEFFNSDDYEQYYEQKLKERLKEYRQKQAEQDQREEQRERETYLKLKAKYEGDKE